MSYCYITYIYDQEQKYVLTNLGELPLFPSGTWQSNITCRNAPDPSMLTTIYIHIYILICFDTWGIQFDTEKDTAEHLGVVKSKMTTWFQLIHSIIHSFYSSYHGLNRKQQQLLMVTCILSSSFENFFLEDLHVLLSLYNLWLTQFCFRFEGNMTRHENVRFNCRIHNT